jgi:hypothetical protein
VILAFISVSRVSTPIFADLPSAVQAHAKLLSASPASRTDRVFLAPGPRNLRTQVRHAWEAVVWTSPSRYWIAICTRLSSPTPDDRGYQIGASHNAQAHVSFPLPPKWIGTFVAIERTLPIGVPSPFGDLLYRRIADVQSQVTMNGSTPRLAFNSVSEDWCRVSQHPLRAARTCGSASSCQPSTRVRY